MKKIALGILTVAAAGLLFDSVVFAQGARPYQPQYGGWSPGNIRTPNAGGRQLRRNNTPSLSPYLNLLPEAAGTIEGQYLLRTVPQQEFTRSQEQTQRALGGLQSEINTQQRQITSGLSTTGHRTSFMNLGSFYSGR
jgi:hypothetical protein